MNTTESPLHRKTKMSIARDLAPLPHVTEIAVEKRIGTLDNYKIADIFAVIDDKPIAIEVHSKYRNNNYRHEAMQKMKFYTKLGIYCVWVIANKESLKWDQGQFIRFDDDELKFIQQVQFGCLFIHKKNGILTPLRLETPLNSDIEKSIITSCRTDIDYSRGTYVRTINQSTKDISIDKLEFKTNKKSDRNKDGPFKIASLAYDDMWWVQQKQQSYSNVNKTQRIDEFEDVGHVISGTMISVENLIRSKLSNKMSHTSMSKLFTKIQEYLRLHCGNSNNDQEKINPPISIYK